MAELVNKINGPWFSKFDEDLATAFSIYCGISIAHVSRDRGRACAGPSALHSTLGVLALSRWVRPPPGTQRPAAELLCNLQSVPTGHFWPHFPSENLRFPVVLLLGSQDHGKPQLSLFTHPASVSLWKQLQSKPLVSFFLGNVGSRCPELVALA